MYNRTFDTLDEHLVASYLWLEDEDDDAEWFEEEDEDEYDDYEDDEDEDDEDEPFSFDSNHDISDADF